MTQENKELLLQDLCARLPYCVICFKKITNCISDNSVLLEEDIYSFRTGKPTVADYGQYDYYKTVVLELKPYLRPISSMTEEEFEKLKEYSGLKYEQLDLASFQDGAYKCLDFYLNEVPSDVVILVFDWLNAHHFDYRGLIEKNLAIEVTKENNPYV